MDRTYLFQSTGCKVAVFVIGTILLGAALAPPLYHGGKTVVEAGWIENVPVLDSIHGSMERAKFSRYFNRAILAGALIMLFPTLKWLGTGDGDKKTLRERLQVRKNPAWVRHFLIGFFLAAIPLLILGWIYLQKGWYQPRDTDKAIISVLFSALFTGIVVALLEEFVFRGALTSIFSSILKPWPLLISIAVFFALVHFLKPPPGADITDVTAFSGFQMLGLIFSQFGDLYFLAAEFAVLFAIGWVLGYTRLKTGSLWLGIGLHAGWVFGVKTLGPLTSRTFAPAEMMPWLGGNLRVGLVSCLVVCLTGLIVWAWLRRDSETVA
ncbi:MAG: CPBP family intramembrane metalloprotease [Verrucomicrobiales bacterium]|nr:CPBP family intramembrane metalloprotease [Verrucomicrobiales bacterium]